MMAMAVLLQEHAGVSDAEAVELTVVDKRWQLVLGQLGETRPAFSPGSILGFPAHWLNRHDTWTAVSWNERGSWHARPRGSTGRSCRSRCVSRWIPALWKAPGAWRDTLNLLAHAARKIVTCVANLLDAPFEQIATEAGVPLLLESSVKAGLDLRWEKSRGCRRSARAAGRTASDSLPENLGQNRRLPDAVKKPPLHKRLQTMAAIRDAGSGARPDGSGPPSHPTGHGTGRRRISIEDSEMRHEHRARVTRSSTASNDTSPSISTPASSSLAHWKQPIGPRHQAAGNAQ